MEKIFVFIGIASVATILYMYFIGGHIKIYVPYQLYKIFTKERKNE